MCLGNTLRRVFRLCLLLCVFLRSANQPPDRHLTDRISDWPNFMDDEAVHKNCSAPVGSGIAGVAVACFSLHLCIFGVLENNLGIQKMPTCPRHALPLSFTSSLVCRHQGLRVPQNCVVLICLKLLHQEMHVAVLSCSDSKTGNPVLVEMMPHQNKIHSSFFWNLGWQVLFNSQAVQLPSISETLFNLSVNRGKDDLRSLTLLAKRQQPQCAADRVPASLSPPIAQ
ncbi:hypothetical protein R3P38DRAFT_1100175 [Favolaschia claudopus]|uniref:Uncharacterized protein n=1 Tax=Favolaschia claudopus TaxID=2862362 RepID=A0AAW0BB72_9AGAR